MSMAHRSPGLDPALQDNARMFCIGVSHYDAFPGDPVESATNNALSWVLQGLRMGVSPYSNPVAVHEAGDPATLAERLADILAISDLSTAERTGLETLMQHVGPNPDWSACQPTHASILSNLVFLGNHLEWNDKCRLLVTYSGHGAWSEGRLVLTASDTVAVDAAPTDAENQARLDTLVATLQGRGPHFDTAIGQIQEMYRIAGNRGVRPELLDILAAPVASMGVRYRDEVIVQLLKFTEKNLRAIPQQGARPTPSWGRVINPFHVLLALGPHNRRATLVVDACHSGGPSDTLQGAFSGHGWIQAGLRCRIISSSEAGQQSAEARIGTRRFSAATWAMTQVLSRWTPVQDQEAYALGIRNGDLVLRANMLLEALSFRQNLGFHAPRPEAADFAFFGLHKSAHTTSQPMADAGGIQLGSDTNEIAGWVVRKHPAGAIHGLLLAVGQSVPSWSYRHHTFTANRLYIFSTPGDVNELKDGPFNLEMFEWLPSASAPPPVQDALNKFPAPSANVQAIGDPGEQPFSGTVNEAFQFQKPGGKEVVLKWTDQGGPGAYGQLIFMTRNQPFPFMPVDFETGAMQFNPAPPNFPTGSWEHVISLS